MAKFSSVTSFFVVFFECNRTLIVRLASMAGTGYFYMMRRNRLKDKLQMMKYDPIGVYLTVHICII